MSEEQFTRVIDLLEKLASDNATVIAIWSVVIAILALITTIVFNIITHRQYIKSLSPLLSFEFFGNGGILYLSVTNTGRSLASGIKVEIEEIINNGKQGLDVDDIFKDEFMLYPNEKIQGVVAFSGESVENSIFPVIKAKVSYLKDNDNKRINYNRTITFTRVIERETNLHNIENELNSMSHSMNRLTNYMEGRCLMHMDSGIDVMPRNSLFKDIKDAINNVKREDDIEEREKTIKDRMR